LDVFCTSLARISHRRSGGKLHFFAPDKEKHAAFLRAQKNVAEQNVTKGRKPRLAFYVT